MTTTRELKDGLTGTGNNGEVLAPFRLRPFFSERVWGKSSLAPWYEDTGTQQKVGEAWLSGPQCVVATGPMAGETLNAVAREHGASLLGGPGGEFPLLVKLLFPDDKLSVQVHPDDARAQTMGQPRGKTECWYVLEAEPGAAVALGLHEGTDAQAVRRGIADGTVEQMLVQVPVAVGDMIFVDAGTVHAIGPGVVLLETQQTSDTTFRMWDYGRPRELHVEQGIAATKFMPRAVNVSPQQMPGFTRLIAERYFTVDRFDLSGGHTPVRMDGPGCLIGLRGSVMVGSDAEQVELLQGTAVVVPAQTDVLVSCAGAASFARCMAPVGAG